MALQALAFFAGRAPGFGYIGSPAGGVAFGMKDFWQRPPVKLDIRNATTDLASFTIWHHSPDAPVMAVSSGSNDAGKFLEHVAIIDLASGKQRGPSIGLPGPPHLPYGGPAGLQSHTVRNLTDVDLGKPVDHMLIDVKHEPGLSLPKPVKYVYYEESHPQLSPGEINYPGAMGGAAGGYCPPGMPARGTPGMPTAPACSITIGVAAPKPWYAPAPT